MWLDASHKLKRMFENGVKPFRIQFIGEEAVDAGGPKKEFYTLLFEDVKKYLLCTGDGISFTFLHDIEKIRNGDFHVFGSLVAIALLEQCSGPRFFLPCVVSKFLKGPQMKPAIDDLPDYEVKEKLHDLLAPQSHEEFEKKVGDFHERFSFSVTRPSIKIDEREQ